MFKPFFENSSYDTPKDKSRKFIDKLFMNTRWYFVGGYVNVIIKSRKLALKSEYDNKAWAESSYRVFKLVEDCGGKIHLDGLDNLKLCEGPVVFVSNHMSTLETFIFPCIIAPLMDVTFVVKESLVKHKLFGPVMQSRDPIVVQRVNPREDLKVVMSKGQELLENGTSVIIFPQSTRSVEFIPEEFNSLGIKLAKAAKVQVVPVAIKTDFWGNGNILKDVGPVDRSSPVHITFGKPFLIEGNGKEEHNKIVNFISENLIKWGGKVRKSD